MPHNASSLTSWAKAIKVTLDGRGVDSAALFAEAGLDDAALDDPNARYPLPATSRLWDLAVDATGDECLGLDVGRNINQTTFHALGYALLASPTLAEAFERLVRYFRVVSDAAELEFRCEGEACKFLIHPLPGGQQPADAALDAMMSVVMRLCRALAGREFRARCVRFRRRSPQDARVFEKVFRAPLVFAAAETSIEMARAALELPLPAANAELARHNEEILARYVARLQRENVANRVHAALVAELPHGEPSQERIADSLHMSLRNLQRKLSAEGTSYKDILNRTRHELALSYMRDLGYSISEITYLLGFADTSSFSRAFKRWTGMTPKAYRASV